MRTDVVADVSFSGLYLNRHGGERGRRCNHGQRRGLTGVQEDSDRLGDSSDDRVVQSRKIADRAGMTAINPNSKTVSDMTGINVLTIVGLRASSVARALAKVASECSADGITLNTFDSLGDLPRYTEALENRGTPSSVGALRTAAAEADAVLVVTTYHGRMPAMMHNAIDWLTRRWDQGALHDKPLAVIGRAAGCYTGVWSHQAEDADGIAGHRVIEPITVATLGEAIKMLAGEVHVLHEPAMYFEGQT
jgi:hypothetical protein